MIAWPWTKGDSALDRIRAEREAAAAETMEALERRRRFREALEQGTPRVGRMDDD